jgi:hypothetical protein
MMLSISTEIYDRDCIIYSIGYIHSMIYWVIGYTNWKNSHCDCIYNCVCCSIYYRDSSINKVSLIILISYIYSLKVIIICYTCWKSSYSFSYSINCYFAWWWLIYYSILTYILLVISEIRMKNRDSLNIKLY